MSPAGARAWSAAAVLASLAAAGFAWAGSEAEAPRGHGPRARLHARLAGPRAEAQTRPRRAPPRAPRRKAPAAPASPERTVRVSHAVDGDTLRLDDGERVRLVGVDTPETHHPRKPVQFYGPEAANFTQQAVEGRRVRLWFDHEYRDRYGRLLAYVVRDEAWMLNEELLRGGFAQVYRRFRFRMKARFLGIEEEARRAKRGMWAHPERIGSPAAERPPGR